MEALGYVLDQTESYIIKRDTLEDWQIKPNGIDKGMYFYPRMKKDKPIDDFKRNGNERISLD